MQFETVGQKNWVIMFVLVKNAAKNILAIIHVEIDIVLCVKIMPEKNGLKTNLAIY